MSFKLALVTGASSGIGRALCQLLAEHKIPLLIHGRNRSALEQLAKQWQQKVPVTILVADFSKAEQQDSFAETILKYQPDLVINNAGFGLYGEALSYQTMEELNILRVNGEAVARFTLEAARSLVEKGKSGVIMNIASVAGYPISPCSAMYAASKAFVIHFSESLDEEVRTQGVRILTACPGVVDTAFRERAQGRRLPGEQMMSPEYAAQQIWWQINTRKKTHIFNSFYRLAIFLVQYIFPKSLVAWFMGKKIKSLAKGKWNVGQDGRFFINAHS